MYRRATLAVASAGTALALLTACGTATVASNDSSATPKNELTHSIRALTRASALTTTLSLDTTAAAITKLATMGGGPDPLTTAQATAIADAHVTVEVIAPKGESVAQAQKSPVKTSESVAIGTGATTYLSLRSVNGVIYLQVDVKGFLSLIGQSSQYSTLQSQVASLPAFVKALVAGKWVSISLATVKDVEALIKAAVHGKIPSVGQSRKLDGQLVAAVLGALSVTRASTGTTDHLVITGNVRTIVRRVLKVVAKAIPEFGTFEKGVGSSVPKLPIVFNAFVTRGALSKLTFDPGQFAKKHPFSLPIVAAFARSGAPIVAPTGATAITLTSLGGLIGGFTHGLGSATGTLQGGPDYLPSAAASPGGA
jgi:hypothetical protein